MNEPAFPLHNHGNQTLGMHLSGMTLRDYFAAKAMEALIIAHGSSPQGGWPTYAERTAYTIADAMLKARKQ